MGKILDHITVIGDGTLVNSVFTPIGASLKRTRQTNGTGCSIVGLLANPSTALNPLEPLKIASPHLNSLGNINLISYNKQNQSGLNQILPELDVAHLPDNENISFEGELTGNLSMFLYYQEATGIKQRFITVAELLMRKKRYTPIAYPVSGDILDTAFSDWIAINDSNSYLSGIDTSKEYALIGAYSNDDISIGKIAFHGNDLPLPIMLQNSNDASPNWFLYLARMFNTDLIPVFDFKNLDSLQISLLANIGTISNPTVTFNFVELI
jgi:hypothetical protein